MMNRLVNLEKLANGNLKITLTDEGRQDLPTIVERKGRDSDSVMYELLEYYLSNGWDYVPAEKIGAMTGCDLIITDDIEWDDNREDIINIGKVYWHANYMVESPVDALENDGLILTGV